MLFNLPVCFLISSISSPACNNLGVYFIYLMKMNTKLLSKLGPVVNNACSEFSMLLSDLEEILWYM